MDINQIDIKSEKIPCSFDGYKICQISDLHNRDFKGELLNKIDGIKPNIIVITGDIIDREGKYKAAIDFCEGASKLAQVYYVNGNHESVLNCYSSFKSMLISAGVNVLENRAVELTCDNIHGFSDDFSNLPNENAQNNKVFLLGLSDPRFFSQCKVGYRQELNRQMELLGDKNYVILLTHRPEMFDDYVNAKVDLAFVGHAHGGQVRLPFLGALYAPNQGLFPRLVKGAHKKLSTTMVISRGLGNSNIVPRILNTPEIIVANLHSLKQQ